jgi:hypothetical protein
LPANIELVPISRILEVDTISFARCGRSMILPAGDRARLILAASNAYAPDLLVTAGYAIHNRKHLRTLANEISKNPRAGTIITEVHHDGHAQRSIGRIHAMWAIHGDGTLHRFGRQVFATSKEARDPDEDSLARFQQQLAVRTLQLPGFTMFALICGELNIVHGRERPRFLDDAAREAMEATDIIINPTHDRMSNAGTLQAKRSLLSRPHANSAARAYVSVSNWEACGLKGRVQRPSPTLHTVYMSGTPLDYEEVADGAFGFVYRRFRVQLGLCR